MPKFIINDPHDFLEVSIRGRSTQELRQEAVERQEWARTIVHDASDRLPQWKDRSDLGFNVERGPEKHVHSMEDSALISRAQSIDGNEVNPRLYPEGKRQARLNTKSPYRYDDRTSGDPSFEPKTGSFPKKKPTKLKPSKDTEI